MDREDILYLVAVLLTSLGAWGAFGRGYGLMACGAMLSIPPLVTIFKNRKGPPEK